jgi:hypothetical protein
MRNKRVGNILSGLGQDFENSSSDVQDIGGSLDLPDTSIDVGGSLDLPADYPIAPETGAVLPAQDIVIPESDIQQIATDTPPTISNPLFSNIDINKVVQAGGALWKYVQQIDAKGATTYVPQKIASVPPKTSATGAAATTTKFSPGVVIAGLGLLFIAMR